MTTFSKVLALFTTAACFAFLGFVTVSLIAGPNWRGETNNFPEYVFEYTPGESPTWAAKRRDNNQAVGSASPILPKKIVDVLNQIKQDQQARIALLDGGTPNVYPPNGITGLETYLNDPNIGIKALLNKDIAALNAQQLKLHGDLQALRDALETTSRQVTMTVTNVEAIFLEAERRRGDIYRLQNLVAEAETDRFRAVEHQKKLRDTWERYQGVIERLKQRNEILRQQIEQKQRLKYEDPETGM
jgi:hypothetical protein